MIDPRALRYRCQDRQAPLQLLQELPQISPLLADLLVGRGYRDAGAVRDFLRPDPSQLHSPWALRHMDRAVDYLRSALAAGQRILIHGDYDCDGICATALLLEGLSELGGQVDYHIPDRFTEGYGLSLKAVERCREEGFAVLLSVDCGSSSHREIAAAQEAGVVVLITDHHQVPDPPPQPEALVNPGHPEDRYPFRGLCGTGVAFKLLQALRGEHGLEPESLLDLVALATIADVVPLVDENRLLVQRGLALLSRAPRPGVAALLESAGRPAGQEVDSFTVGFTLGPRLNASGRLEHARAGVELLRCRDRRSAQAQAAHLERLNEERKECEQAIAQEIEERFRAEPERLEQGAIVEWGEGWHEGVIGITAGRLAQRYGVPALVISVHGEQAKGSGRSPENVDLYAALCGCGGLLSKYGGHPRAGGFSLSAARLPELRQEFCRQVQQLRQGLAPVWVDASLGLSQLTPSLVQGLSKLEPFGEGNPRPVFLLEGVTLAGQRTVGREGDHLQLELEQGGRRQRAIAFRQGDQIDQLDSQQKHYDLLCQVALEEFQGQTQLQLQVVGIVRPQDSEGGEGAIVDRRHTRARRQELVRWLREEPGYLAVCSDPEKTVAWCPECADQIVTYAGLQRPAPGWVLLNPPRDLAEWQSALEASRPQRVVVLFGRQELDAWDREVGREFWGRREATSAWKVLERQRPDHFPRREVVEELERATGLPRRAVEEILEAFLELGVLRPVPQHQLWSLGSRGERKLEETRAFALAQERRLAHHRLRELFTGPDLTQALGDCLPWVGEKEPV